MRPLPTLSASVQSASGLALAAAVLLGGVLGVLPAGAALFVGASFASLGGVALLRELREASLRRELADDLIETLVTPRVPVGLRWRAEELTSPRERRRLARSLRSLLNLIDRPGSMAVTPITVNWRAIRRERRTVEEVAAVLADTRRAVRPRGVVLARRLVLDYLESPLYARRHANDLHRALVEVRVELRDDRI